MKKTDPQTTATMLALGLLSDAEARAAAEAISRSMPQRLQAAAVQDIGAALMLAQSPAPKALPAHVLAGIQQRIAQAERRKLWLHRGTTALRWSGWIAAAAMAMLMLRHPQGQPSEPTVAASTMTGVSHPPAPRLTSSGPAVATETQRENLSNRMQEELHSLRSEVDKLSAQLAVARHTPGTAGSVSMMGFSRNGKASPLSSVMPSGSGLANVIAGALKPYLVRSAASRQIGPEIVIDRGFGAFTAATLPEGYYFRHTHFPEAEWQALGLLAANDGSFYDPHGQLVWQPDATQPGSFIGYRPQAGIDTSRYTSAPVVAATQGNPNTPTTQGPATAPVNPKPSSGNPVVASSTVPFSSSPTAKATPTTPTVDPVVPEPDPEPPIVAVTDPATGDGTVIVPELVDLAPPFPDAVIQLWSVQTDPKTGKVTYQPVGQSAGIAMAVTVSSTIPNTNPPNNPPIVGATTAVVAGSSGYFNLTAQEIALMSSGAMAYTWEKPSQAPPTTPNGMPTVIIKHH